MQAETYLQPGEVIRPVDAATARELARLAASPLSEAASGAGERVLDDAALVAERLLDAVTSGPLRSRSFLARNRIDSTGTVR